MCGYNRLPRPSSDSRSISFHPASDSIVFDSALLQVRCRTPKDFSCSPNPSSNQRQHVRGCCLDCVLLSVHAVRWVNQTLENRMTLYRGPHLQFPEFQEDCPAMLHTHQSRCTEIAMRVDRKSVV